MKSKLYAVVAFAFIGVLLAAAPFALAQEADASDDNLEGDAGTTPDSAGYGLKLGWEKIELWFTFKQEKKAEKELALADKRLLEAKKMAEKGNIKAMERAQEKHDALIASAQERLASIQEDSQESQVKETTKKVIGLEVALRAHQNRIEVLKDILAEKNLSEEARTAIEAVIAKMENKASKMELKIEQKKDKIKIRLRAITNKSESEVEVEMEDLEEEEGLVKSEKAIAEKRIEKTEEALKKIRERFAEKKRIKADATVSAIVEAQILAAEKLLEEAKSLYAQGNYSEAIELLKPVSNYGRNLKEIVHKIGEERRELIKGQLDKVAEQVKKAREKANKTEFDDDLDDESDDSEDDESEPEDENETESNSS